MKFKVISRKIVALFIIVLLMFLCAFSAISFADKISPETASLKITLRDSFDASYIKDATVFVLETESYFKTDEKGQTGIINIPYERDARYDSTSSKNFMEITLLIYKEGYIDYILLHTAIYSGEVKNKLVILDKKQDDLMSYYVFTDEANHTWIEKIIAKYKKY